MKVIIDTDLASAFAKTESLFLLEQLFGKTKLVITAEIYKELTVPLNYGYSFPHTIFKKIKIIYPNNSELIEYQKKLSTIPKLGRGELEAITLCESRGYAYAAIDRQALTFAESVGIVIFPLDVILRLLWVLKISTKNEPEKFIIQLEAKDNLRTKEKEKLFEEN